jgi:hypothetical protein
VDDATANAIIVHLNTHKNSRQVGHYTACQYATWKIAQINGIQVATGFYDSMVEGVGLTEVDPRLHLARYLRSRPGAGSTHHTRLQTVIAYIKAFNAWTTGKPMSLLRVTGTENMPVVLQAFFNRTP